MNLKDNSFVLKIFNIITTTSKYNLTYKLKETRVIQKTNLNILPTVYLDYLKNNKKISFYEFFNLFNQNKIARNVNLNKNNILLNNKFISLDVIMFYEYNNLIYNYYVLDDIHLHVYSLLEDEDKDKDKVKLNIKNIFLIVKFMQNYKSNKNNNNINIYIFLSYNKKYLYYPHVDKDILTQFNCNSGLSYDNNICIWRIEELHKVLIHELMHNLNLDDKNLICNHKYNINENTILYNESYVELYAELIYLIFYCFLKDKSLVNFDKYLLIEVNFSLLQVSKILKYFKIYNIKDLFNNNNNIFLFNQATSVFSYYVLKTSGLFNIIEFLKLTLDDDIKKFFDESLLKDTFVSKINKLLLVDLSKESMFIRNNLRMTRLEFNIYE
jgi:hypothetical protein